MSNKTAMMMGVFALAASTALAQSSTTTSGQAAGSGTTSGQASSTDKTRAGSTDKGSSATSSSSSAGMLSAADKKFVMEAARGGMAEVELGQLAAQKASSSEVKSFGQMMVDDHTKANDELKSLASGKGITVPTDLDAKSKAQKARLEKLSGEEFDRAYMRDMERDHRKDVAEFKRESASGKDQELKDWAGKTLPTLEKHLQHAEQTASAVGAGGQNALPASGSSPTKSQKKKSSGSSNPGSR